MKLKVSRMNFTECKQFQIVCILFLFHCTKLYLTITE